MPSKLMDSIFGYFDTPDAAMAAGLLAPTQYGTFGEGVLQGMQASGNKRRSDNLSMLSMSEEAMRRQQLKEIERKAAERKALQQYIGSPGQEMIGPLAPNQQRPFVGGAGILQDQRISPAEQAGLLKWTEDPYKAMAYMQATGPQARSDRYYYAPHEKGIFYANYSNPRETGVIPYGSSGTGGRPTPGLPAKYSPGMTGDLTTAKETAKSNVELEFTQPDAEAAVNGFFASTDKVKDEISKAAGDVNWMTSGVLGWTRAIGGTPAADLEGKLAPIRSALGLDALLELRQAGGNLGQVTEAEHRLLQDKWTALSQSQSPSQLRDNLKDLVDTVEKSRARIRKAYEKKYKKPASSNGTIRWDDL